MRYRQFLLSFTATALLVTPLVLNAKAPPGMKVRMAPVPGQDSRVNGLAFHSAIIKQDASGVTLRIDAKNDGYKPIDTEVVATLMMRPSSSPVRRMAPRARQLDANKLHIVLAPGKQFSKTFTVKLPKSVAQRMKRAAKSAPNKKILAPFRMSPPSFFTMVRPLEARAAQARQRFAQPPAYATAKLIR